MTIYKIYDFLYNKFTSVLKLPSLRKNLKSIMIQYFQSSSSLAANVACREKDVNEASEPWRKVHCYLACYCT